MAEIQQKAADGLLAKYLQRSDLRLSLLPRRVKPDPRQGLDYRIQEIDGLRGWASLSVVVFHMLQETMGILHPGIVSPWLRIFMDGPVAVYVFFLLSGDALSTAYVSKQNLRTLDGIIAKRYFRLSIPILLAVLPTYFIMKMGWVYSRPAGNLVHMADWLGTFLQFSPSLKFAVTYSLAGVYGWCAAPYNWNTFLWTMPVEMYGSFLVFSYLHIIHRLRYQIRTTLVLAVLFSIATEYYGLFFFGMLLAQLRARGILASLRHSWSGVVAGLIMLSSAYGLEYCHYAYPLPPPNDHHVFAQLDLFLMGYEQHILGALIVSGCYLFLPALLFLRSGVSRVLGKLSFGLYLYQFPILASFESGMIVHYRNHLSDWRVAIVIAFSSIVLTAVVAAIFSVADDFILRRVGDQLRKLFKAYP